MKATIAEVNLTALQHNLKQVKQLTPDSHIMVVCKANGYGHGLVEVAQALSDADAFGVARIEEAIKLRQSGVKQKIVLLEGFFEASDIDTLLKYQLDSVIHTEEQLTQLICATKDIHLNYPIKIWLKVDSGMHRLGIHPDQVNTFLTRLNNCTGIDKHIVLMSHFACADEVEHDFNQHQISQFQNIQFNPSVPKPIACSMANSAAILNKLTPNYQWVRPGIMLYGVSPIKHKTATDFNLKPVMSFKSHLIAIKTIEKGASVGYGCTWQASQRTKIGVVAVGYGDGYPRHAKNGCPVLINGRITPLVGRVSMDMITVELGLSSEDKIGDEVTLWGNGLAIEEIAQAADTIPYELLCQLTSRVKICYTGLD